MFPVILACVIFVVTTVVLQFYQQWAFRRWEPITFAVYVRAMLALGYALTYVVATVLGRRDDLLKSAKVLPRLRSWAIIIIVSLLFAISTTLDTLAFLFQDLVSKQVLDMAFPVVLLIVGPLTIKLLSDWEPVRNNYVLQPEDDDDGVEMTDFNVNVDANTVRRKGYKRIYLVQRLLAIPIAIVCAVAIVTSPKLSEIGVAVNVVTLFANGIVIVIFEQMLVWQVFTRFKLLLFSIVPETLILFLIARGLGEKAIGNESVPHAAIIAIIDLVRKIATFYILHKLFHLDLSVCSNVAAITTATINAVLRHDLGPVRVTSTILLFILGMVYAILGFVWRKRALKAGNVNDNVSGLAILLNVRPNTLESYPSGQGDSRWGVSFEIPDLDSNEFDDGI